MLEPTNRHMFVDALRPPSGYTLDAAVGTSFTLDLDALLLATLSFTAFDRMDGTTGTPDPIAMLESVRRHAENISVFAQAGALSVSGKPSPILAYLEASVIPVRPPLPGHIFHPKVWALRFVTSGSEEARYRLLIMSRNLTFASSWDTIVQLDGAPTSKPIPKSAIVGDFIDQLQALALLPIGQRRAKQIDQLAADLRTVKWELPPDVRWLKFHPLGPKFKSPTIKGNRLLVISPFLTPGMVTKLGANPGDNILVSRASALDRIGQDGLSGFAETRIIETLDPPSEETDSESLNEGTETEAGDLEDGFELDPPRPGSELSGLHAKVYVTEGDDYTRLWMGSANATGAAFAGNAEFMIELGLSPSVKIDDILEAGGKSSLNSLMSSYTPQSSEPSLPTAQEEAAGRVDAILRELAALQYEVAVSANGDNYRLDLSWGTPAEGLRKRIVDYGVDVMIGPATHTNFRVAFAEDGASLPSVSLQTITSFLVLEASIKVEGKEVVGRTLVNARLSGAPEDRNERLLANLLDNPEKVMRYLLFLLSELTGDPTLLNALMGPGGSAASFDWLSSTDSPPLLETLLRALAGAPESLDSIGCFIEDLRSTKGIDMLPAGFEEVWQPVAIARERLK